MTKQTQCPHCLSVFVITNEQLQQSRGKVRCGSCRQPFRATLLAEDYYEKIEDEEEFQFFEDISPRTENSASHRHKAWPSPKQPVEEIIEQTRLDDPQVKDADDAATKLASVEEALEKALSAGFDDPEIDISTFDEASEATSFTEETPRFFDEPLSEASLDQLTGRSSKTTSEIDWASISSDHEYSTEGVDDLESNLSAALNGTSMLPSEKYWDDELSITEETSELDVHYEQVEIELPKESNERLVPSEETKVAASDPTAAPIVSVQGNKDSTMHFHDEQELINEVDQLIEEKLLVDPESSALEREFQIAGRGASGIRGGKSGGSAHWVARPLLGLLVLVLLSLLLTQLWYRQALAIFENELIAKMVTPIVEPIGQTLEQQFGFALPVRRDLSKMHLLSVHSEVHPTRSTTQLLKVSLVNQADIGQPYPWFELILSDEDGRLVSRRSLSPKDYLHNNRLSEWIGPKELRRITIELLAFPKQAHGYELRVLNK